MSGVITNAGVAYIAQRSATLQPVVIDHFVLANVPNADANAFANTEPNRASGLPAAGQQAGNFDVARRGYNNDNAVTYTLELGSAVGDFDFNAYYAVTDTGVVIAIKHIHLVQKRAGIQQVVTRNLVTPYDNAKALTGIDIPVETWQFDYTAEMVVARTEIQANTFALVALSTGLADTHVTQLKHANAIKSLTGVYP